MVKQKRINVDDKLHVCTLCKIDKKTAKKFISENNMDSVSVLPELTILKLSVTKS